MDFEPTETQALIRQTAAEFARRELAPKAAERDRHAIFPEGEMRALGALRLLGVNVPEAYGGAGAGPVALALAVREIAAADASVAVTMAVTNMVAEILARHAGEDVRRRLLPGLVSGDAVAGSFALSEPQSGSDAVALATTARPAAAGYTLRGSKLWITSGDRAGVLIVMARHLDEGGARDGAREARGSEPRRPRISAFALEAGTPGLAAGRHERKMGQCGSSTVPLTLDDVFVPEAQRLGAEGDGFGIAMNALQGGRIGVAAMAVGVGQAAVGAAMTYARQRHQFGRPIAEFQAVQSQIADSATSLEAAWLLTLAAAAAKERGGPDLVLRAAEAKLFSSERALDACDRAIQILGGYGYSREFPVERFFRDARVMTIYEGTSQIQRLVIARELLRHARERRP